MADDYNPLVDAAPYTHLPGTQQFWDDLLRYGSMPAPGAPNPNENFYGDDTFVDRYSTLDKSMVHAPPYGDVNSTVAIQDRSWEDQAPSLTDVSWDHFPKVTSRQSSPVLNSPNWDLFPKIGGPVSIPPVSIPLLRPQQPPVMTTATADTPVARATPVQTPAVTTGPATLTATKPILGTYRAMSFGPGNFPGADKPTGAVLYGALEDKQGNPVKLTTSDIAMSPNLLQKHNLKLGDYVDVLDDNGNVIYPHQRIADKSYVSKGNPTTDTIELWGRPDIGHAQIRPSS